MAAISLELGARNNLIGFHVTGNNLIKTIPPTLCFSSWLDLLLMGNNSFKGRIPSKIGNCQSVNKLRLGHKCLSGVIPFQFLGLNLHIDYMDMKNNNLQGEIPSSLGTCINLSSIDHMNSLSGTIHPELGQLSNLQQLNLSFLHYNK